jgi:hypothetical protein
MFERFTEKARRAGGGFGEFRVGFVRLEEGFMRNLPLGIV